MVRFAVGIREDAHDLERQSRPLSHPLQSFQDQSTPPSAARTSLVISSIGTAAMNETHRSFLRLVYEITHKPGGHGSYLLSLNNTPISGGGAADPAALATDSEDDSDEHSDSEDEGIGHDGAAHMDIAMGNSPDIECSAPTTSVNLGVVAAHSPQSGALLTAAASSLLIVPGKNLVDTYDFVPDVEGCKYSVQGDAHPEGFRGEYHLRRHREEKHQGLTSARRADLGSNTPPITTRFFIYGYHTSTASNRQQNLLRPWTKAVYVSRDDTIIHDMDVVIDNASASASLPPAAGKETLSPSFWTDEILQGVDASIALAVPNREDVSSFLASYSTSFSFSQRQSSSTFPKGNQ
ncbi:hypothetical protein GGS20DRAFT_588936 [Poronia punctata]|nr:hypothetical protein GGS20DRAFT_588936 [Poronia punctata]